MKRVWALLFCVALMAAMAVSVNVMPATAAGIEATEEDTILIAFSDFQLKDGNGPGEQRLQALAATLEAHGMKTADGLIVAGDYNASGSYTDPSSITMNQQSMGIIRSVFSPFVGENILFSQGNHDLASTPGLAPEGNNDPASGAYGVYVIPEDKYGEWGTTPNETKQAAADLKAYLDAKVSAGWKKPIFVINHIPLHWGNRTLKDGSSTQGYLLFNELNAAGAKGLNIIYLFGHNHSSGYDDFLGSSAIYLKKGDKMEVAQGDKYVTKTETLNFTYMNAGYVGYNSSTDSNADTALTLSVFLIRGNEVIITRYDADGVHNLKSAGIWNPSFSEEGYHATPNTTVYASSRKVTATDDVAVEPPYYSKKAVATTTQKPTTTGSKQPTTTGTQPTSGPVYKPTVIQKTEPTSSASAAAPTTTGLPVDTSAAPSVADTSAVPTGDTTTIVAADPTQSATEPAPSQTVIEDPCVMPEDEGEDTSATPDNPFPVGVVLGIGGGVVVVGAAVVLLLMKRKK